MGCMCVYLQSGIPLKIIIGLLVFSAIVGILIGLGKKLNQKLEELEEIEDLKLE